MAGNNTALAGTPGTTVTTAAGLNTALSNGGTITFGANITETLAAPSTAGVGPIVDGAGYSLTGSSAGAALALSAGTLTLGNLTISSAPGGAISLSGAGTAVLFEADSPTSTALGTISGVISGTGALTVGTTNDAVTGTALVLNGAETYTGATTIYDTLYLGANGSFGSSASVTLGANTVTAATSAPANGILDISNAQTSVGGTVLVNVNNLTSAANTGTIYLGLNSLQVTESTATSFGGAIDNTAISGATGGGGLTVVAGTTTFTLAQGSSYAGSTKIMSGTLALGPGGTISDSANVSLKASGARFDISGSGPTAINELTGVAGSSVVLGSTALTVTENFVAASFSGFISGTGALTLGGTYELSLAGANTYTGATTINSGATLGILGAGSLATSSISGSGTFDIAGATASVTVSQLTTSGEVTLGADRLILNGLSAPSGIISGTGAVQVGTAAVTGVTTLAGVETYTGSTVVYGSLNLSAAGSIATSANVSLKASGALFTTATAQATAIHELTGVGGTVALGTQALTITENVVAASFAGVFTGSGALTIAASSNTLTLTGASTAYLGALTVASGATLALSGAGSLGAPASVAVNGTFNIAGVNTGNLLAGSIQVAVTNLSGSGRVVEGANSLSITSATASTFSGVISGTGGVTLVSGTETLGGTNTYTGVTTITSGVLNVDSDLPSSSIIDNGTLTMGNGVGLTYLISGTGGLTVSAGSSSSATATATILGADTFTGITSINQYNTLVIGSDGGISGSSISDSGTIDLSKANLPATLNSVNENQGAGSIVLGSYGAILTGTVTLSGAVSGAGGVQIGNFTNATAAIVSASETYTGATLIFGTETLILSGSISASSSVSLRSASSLNVSGTTATTVSIHTLMGDEENASVVLGAHTLDVTQNDGASFLGVISGVGGSLIIDAAGTAILGLGSVNTYTGATTVNGALALLVAHAIDSSSSVTEGSAGALTLEAAETLNNFSGSGGTLNLNNFTLNDNNNVSGSHLTFSGLITEPYSYYNAGGLTETGSTTGYGGASTQLTLSHADNVYTGATTIVGGTLEVGALGAAGRGSVTFADAGATAAQAGVLQIDNAALTDAGTATQSFANAITGFSTQDVIDLTGLAYSSLPGSTGGTVTFANGMVVVTEGNASISLNIAGATATNISNYHAFEDSHGGTFIAQFASTDTTHYHP